MPDQPGTGERPDEPFTELMQGAMASHELFMAYVRAGFTRAEALQIIIAMAREGLRTTLGASDDDA